MPSFGVGKLISVISIFIVLFLAGYAGYELYFYKSVFSDLRISRDIENFEKYPYIRWGDIRNGKLAKFLKNNDKTSLSSTIAFNGYYRLNDMLYQDLGIDYLLPERNDIYLDPNQGIEKRPYKIVAFFRTGVNKQNYLLYVVKILNIDGSTVYIPMITDKNLLRDGNDLSKYYQLLTDSSKNNFFSPVLKIADASKCSKVFPHFKTYCNWLGKNKKAQEKLNNIMETAVNKGVIASDVEKIPVMLKLTVLY
ncbi:MAG: hypothetical protein HND47_05455 [Chloroflexi bacterium]|nr:hypothetical protein [Chloroflexota bacterium]